MRIQHQAHITGIEILIIGFYRKLNDREAYILSNEVHNSQKLTKYNQECIDLANKVHENIEWIDYYKFDWFGLALPLIIIGSFFITFVCEGIPYLVIFSFYQIEPIPFIIFVIISFITRSIAAFVIIKPAQKSLYSITAKGRKLLRGWIAFLSAYS